MPLQVGKAGLSVGIDIRQAAVKLASGNIKRLRASSQAFAGQASPCKLELLNVFMPSTKHKVGHPCTTTTPLVQPQAPLYNHKPPCTTTSPLVQPQPPLYSHSAPLDIRQATLVQSQLPLHNHNPPYTATTPPPHKAGHPYAATTPLYSHNPPPNIK